MDIHPRDRHTVRTVLLGIVLARVTTNLLRQRGRGRRQRRFVQLRAG